MNKASRKKREKLKTLELYLINYKRYRAFHCDMGQIDQLIQDTVEELKTMD